MMKTEFKVSGSSARDVNTEEPLCLYIGDTAIANVNKSTSGLSKVDLSQAEAAGSK